MKPWNLYEGSGSRADCAARNRKSFMKDPEKSRVYSAAQSRESYKKELEKNHNDSAARSHESYLKDPEKSCTKQWKLQEGLGEESRW